MMTGNLIYVVCWAATSCVATWSIQNSTKLVWRAVGHPFCNHTLGRSRVPVGPPLATRSQCRILASGTMQDASHTAEAANQVTRTCPVAVILRESNPGPWHRFPTSKAVLGASTNRARSPSHPASRLDSWSLNGRSINARTIHLTLDRETPINYLVSHHDGGHCHSPHWPHRVWEDLLYPVCNQPRPETNA